MKKVVLVSVSFLILCGLLFWVFTRNPNGQQIVEDQEDKSGVPASSETLFKEPGGNNLVKDEKGGVKGKAKLPDGIKKNPLYHDNKAKELSEAELDQLEEYFERTEKAWQKRMQELVEKEFGLGSEVTSEYNKLRESFNGEKMSAFEEFHSEMEEKYGESYSYEPSEDQEVFDTRIKEQYQTRLKELLGDENFSRYNEVLKDFNQQIEKEQDPQKGVMLIDF